MTDFASLGLSIDSTQVKQGVQELDKLTAAGARAEKASGDLAKAQAGVASQATALRTEVNAGRITQEQYIEKLTAAARSLDGLKAAQRTAASEYNKMSKEAAVAGRAQQTAAQQVSQVMKSTTVSAGQMRAGMQQLSFQIGDVATMFAMGAPPMRIFASQGTQVVQAVSMMTNSTKGLIGFLAGPWGAVMLGAVTILGSLAASHDSAGAATDKHKDAADELTQAMKELDDATASEMQSTQASIKTTIAKANALMTQAGAAREAAVAELQLAKARLEGARAGARSGEPGAEGIALVLPSIEADTKRIQAEIDKQESIINRGARVLRGQRGKQIQQEVEEKFDAATAAAGKYERRLDSLNGMLRFGIINETSYRAALEEATATRNKEEEAARKSERTHKERKKGISDEERAYKAAVKASEQYIDNLELEIEKIGKTAAQIRQIEIARAKEAAPTAALKAKIDELNVSREKALAITEAEEKAKERKKNDAGLLDPIKTELALLGLTGEARARAALQMEFEAKQAQMLAGDLNISAEALQNWYDTNLKIIEGESALEREAQAARDLIDALSAVAENAQVVGDIMASAFGGLGGVFGGIVAGMADFQVQSAAMAEEVKKGTLKQEVAAKRLHTLEVKNTAQAIAGVKSLFKEKSTAFKVMQAIEMAYAAFQAAETIASMVRDSAKTASHVSNSATRTAANTAEGGSKIFAELGPWAFPVVAAMVAVLAALGAKGGGGGGSGPKIPTAEDVQAGQGAGSVLGDAKAKSNSIANSLEIVASNTNKDLEYSNQMLRALQSIDLSISKMAGTVARQIQVSGSMFDTSKLRIGTSSSGGFLGIGGSSTTRNLFDLGMTLNSASLGDILSGGISGETFQTIQKIKTKKGFLGIGGGTKTSYKTTTGDIDPEITAAISDVLGALRDGLVSASKVIGLEGAEAILNSFQVSIGKISFKDMTGEQIESELNAIFSRVGDQMAGAILPSLATLQKVGEGLFETFMRVAREYEVVDIALKSIGKTFGMVGVESIGARDALVQLFGSLDDFVDATNFFRDEFLTEAQQMAPIISSVRAEMARLGLASVDTREEFASTVLGLDLTSEAGRATYAALLQVAPAFDKVLDYYEQAKKAQIDALQDTADKFNGFANSLKKYRDSLFATDAAQQTYAELRRKFFATADLAASGSEAGLSGLESAGKDFLSASRNNASSLQQYLRDVAMVAQGVDKGILAAEGVASNAELQLQALTNSVSILNTIATNTAATAQALGAAIPQPAAVGVQTIPSGETKVPAETVQAQADNKAALEAIASLLAEMNRRFNRWDDGNALVIGTRDGDPIDVNLESWG